jgi:hypothetical protein
MAKKKKQKKQVLPAAPPPARAPLLTPRRSVILSIAFLFFLWLIQFFPVLSGAFHFWQDVVEQDYPLRVFARTAILSGEFPHWVPYAFNGMPFFATQVSGVLYPSNMLLSLLPVSDKVFWWLIQANVALHFLIAGLCMFFYMRYKRKTDAASVFAATAFMLGGFLVTHAIHTMMIYILAWFPLVLLLFERGVRELKPAFAVSGGLLLGVTMLAGHPQLTLYELMFLFAIGVYLVYRQRDMVVKRAIIAVVFFCVAGGLCFVQYLPTVEMSALTARMDYTIDEASEGSLQFAQFFTALIPKAFGAHTGAVGVPEFWLEDGFSRGAHIYWETCFYFGVSTLFLSFFWFRRVRGDRGAAFALAWVLGSLCIAFGGNFFVYRLLFDMGVPGFTSFRLPARILFTWGFLFPLVAAAALDSLEDLKSKKLKIVSLSVCGIFALIGIIAASGWLGSFFPQMGTAAKAQYASGQGFVLLLNAGLLGGVLVLFFTDVIRLKTAKALIVACLAIDMLSFAAGQHTVRGGGGAPAEFARAKNNVEMIKSLQGKERFRSSMRQFDLSASEVGRQTSRMRMSRNQGLVDNIELAEGYTAIRLKHYITPLNMNKFNTVLDLTNIKYYIDPHPRKDRREEVLMNKTYLPRAKLFYRAKVVGGDNDSSVLDYMNSDLYDHRNEVVVTDQSLAKFSNGQNGAGNVKITNYKFNKIELDVDTDREAILWMSEIWYPAWKATVNGKKADVYRASYSFRAVAVPAGKSTVIFKFDSIYFNIGALVSLLTLVAASGYLLMEFFVKKK